MKADEIKEAMDRNRCMPSRAELRRMANLGQWDRIGKLFQFTPKMMEFGGGMVSVIDWRSVPPAVCGLLARKKEPISRNNPKRSLSSRKKNGSSGHSTILFKAQKGICFYCHKKTRRDKWTIEHKLPLARGGWNVFSNKAGACGECNQAKSCLTVEEFLTLSPPERKKRIIELQRELNPNPV